MAEPFFGSVPQLWPTTPFPAFGFLQTPMPQGNRSPFGGGLATSVSPISSLSPTEPYGFGAGMTPTSAGSGFGTPLSPIGPSPVGSGITAQTLVGAVAMRRGQPLGPTNDQEIEDFIADALDVLPGTNDVEVRCEGGRATLTGSASHKRIKRDAGEIAWAIPSVTDVQNNIAIAARRRARGQGRETETATTTPGRKQT
jgi:BON domain-containing protein